MPRKNFSARPPELFNGLANTDETLGFDNSRFRTVKRGLRFQWEIPTTSEGVE